MAVVLGDNIVERSLKGAVEHFREQERGARILLKEVPDPERFGVAEVKDGKVLSIEEKPEHPSSRNAARASSAYRVSVSSSPVPGQWYSVRSDSYLAR